MPKHSDLQPLGGYARQYLDLLSSLGRAMTTKESVFRVFERWLVSQGIRDIREITPELLSRWRVEMATGLHPRTVEGRLSEIRRFFLFLHSRGVLFKNPAESLLHEAVPRTLPYVFTVQDVRRLLTEGVAAIPYRYTGLRKWVQKTAYTLFHLLYATGMRRSEALGLRVRDLDFEARTIEIRKTKFHKERTIPIGSRAAQNLRAYLAERRARAGELLGTLCRRGVRDQAKVMLEDFVIRQAGPVRGDCRKRQRHPDGLQPR